MSAIKIQVIDKDRGFRSFVYAALESVCLQFVESNTLEQASFELPVSRPDLIIMDNEQSDGDGLQWLEGKVANGLKIPVFVLSSTDHDISNCFCQKPKASNIRLVIHKPVASLELRKAVEQHFPPRQVALVGHSSGELDEIEREIRELALEYVRELPQRFQALIDQVEEIKLGHGDPSAAKSEAHKIKGTASSYGAHDVGAQAVIIDDCLKQLTKTTDVATSEFWTRLDNALKEALRLSNEAVERANAEP